MYSPAASQSPQLTPKLNKHSLTLAHQIHNLHKYRGSACPSKFLNLISPQSMQTSLHKTRPSGSAPFTSKVACAWKHRRDLSCRASRMAPVNLRSTPTHRSVLFLSSERKQAVERVKERSRRGATNKRVCKRKVKHSEQNLDSPVYGQKDTDNLHLRVRIHVSPSEIRRQLTPFIRFPCPMRGTLNTTHLPAGSRTRVAE